MVIVWHRGKAKIKRLLGNVSPETCTVHESTCTAHTSTFTAHESTYRVPYEIVEMIIAHLAHDLGTLKACSLTCRSWHTIVVPLLHYTFTFWWEGPVVSTEPESLSDLHEQGLLDLFTKIRVDSLDAEHSRFAPQAFSHGDLRHFSAFTNVHTLELRHVAIGLFVPDAELYFGHLSPTLRSITLIDSHCHPLQLSNFLSLFPNLDDIKIRNMSPWRFRITTPDTELVPLSAPKLRGRLALHDFNLAETWTDLVATCGGLRFRYMDLFGSAGCAPILLEACAETLETLRLCMGNDLAGKKLCMTPYLSLHRSELTEATSLVCLIRSIGAQGPPISTSTVLARLHLSRNPPPYHRQGGVLDDHIPRVLRARRRPHGRFDGPFILGSQPFQYVA